MKAELRRREKNEPRGDGSSVQRLDGVGDELDVTSLVVGDLRDSLSDPSGVTGGGERLNRVFSESIGVEEVLEVLKGESVVEDEHCDEEEESVAIGEAGSRINKQSLSPAM